MSRKSFINILACLLCLLPLQTTAQTLEYWFDDNFDQRSTTSISTSDAVQELSLDLRNSTKFPYGFHKLYMRIIIDGKPSAVYTSGVLKLEAGRATQLEYWVDGDYANVRTIGGTPTEDGTGYKFVTDLDLGDITPGHHRLYCRPVSNSKVTAGAVTSMPIIVKSKYNIDMADVRMTHYSIAVDDEKPVELSFPHSGKVVDMEHNLDGRYLTKGNHQLKLRLANSMDAAVSVQQTFTVEEQTAPSIALTAEVRNGLVNIKFNSVPSDNSYRIYRVDGNGSSKYIKNEKKSNYPTDICYTDNPPAGTYTYYAKSKYTDINGESQVVKSNEVNVTVGATQAELGYIEGAVFYEGKRKVGFKSNIRFSDNVVVQSNEEGLFRRDNIPAGTELSVFLTENDYYTSDAPKVIVQKGKNYARVNATPRSDCPVNNQMDYGQLTYYDRLIWEPGMFFKLPLTNSSHETWNGKICIKVIPKRYDVEEETASGSGDTQIGQGSSVLAGGVANMSALPFFNVKNYQTFVSEDFQLVYNQNKEVYVPLTGLYNDGPTEPFNFYVYCVKHDGSMSLVRPNFRFDNTQYNPMQYSLEGGTTGGAMTEEERVAYYTNLIVYFCGLVEDVDKIIGKSRDVLGYGKSKLNADYYTLTHASEENIELTLQDEGMQEVVYDMIQKCDHYSDEVKAFRKDIAPFVRNIKDIGELWKYVKDGLAAIKKYSEELSSRNDCERVGYISKKIIDLSASYNPFTPILKKYIDIGEVAIDKILKLSWAYNQTYLPQDMCENKFKLRIRVIQKNGIAINFPFWGSGMINQVLVKGWNKSSNDIAEARFKSVKGNALDWSAFAAVFEQDGIDNSSSLYSDGDVPFTQLWAEIYWRNGRVSYVPLTDGVAGVEYSRGEHSNSIFTITFDSEEKGYGSVADVIHLRE